MSYTTTYEAGQVVVVDIPFSDGSGTKRRPAVVVSTSTFHHSLLDIVICPISSQPRHHESPSRGDHPLNDWKAVGLRHASTARVSKILSVDRRIIGRTLGTLRPDDLVRVREALQAAFGL